MGLVAGDVLPGGVGVGQSIWLVAGWLDRGGDWGGTDVEEESLTFLLLPPAMPEICV